MVVIPIQQTHQPSTIPTPPIHQTPPAPTPSQPEPLTLTVTTPSPPPTPPAFNPEEMINQMKITFKEGLAAAVETANAQQFFQPTPPQLHNDSHFPPPTSHIHDTTHSSRRSPSPHRSEQPVKDDKFPMSAPRSPRHRPRSSRSSRRQPRDSHLTRDVTVPSHSNQSPLILGIPATTSIVKIKPAIATWALFSSS